MGHFDFSLTFTDKIPTLKSTLMNFDGNARHLGTQPGKKHFHCFFKIFRISIFIAW